MGSLDVCPSFYNYLNVDLFQIPSFPDLELYETNRPKRADCTWYSTVQYIPNNHQTTGTRSSFQTQNIWFETLLIIRKWLDLFRQKTL